MNVSSDGKRFQNGANRFRGSDGSRFGPTAETPANSNETKPKVKVCVHAECRARGSVAVAEALRRDASASLDIVETDECFRFCKQGPNVAVDGAVLHGVRPREACSRVRSEIRKPAQKRDAIGTRSIDELDSVLDELFSR